MNGQTICYKRVSSTDQNIDRQLEGQCCDREFVDRLSGKDVNRPALQEALTYVRRGDTLLVHSIDRLARNLADLEKMVNSLTAKGVSVRFVKEGLTFTGEENPMNRLMFQMLGAFSQFERALIRERQREGIAAAKAQGKALGRKPKLTPAQVEELREKVRQGGEKKQLASEYGISRQTLYSLIAA